MLINPQHNSINNMQGRNPTNQITKLLNIINNESVAILSKPIDPFLSTRMNKIDGITTAFGTGDILATITEHQISAGIPVGQSFFSISEDRTGVALEVASTSVNDTSGGTGARAIGIGGIRVEGLNDFVRVPFLFVALNGQNRVTIPHLWLNVEFMIILNVGSLATNEGNVYSGDAGGVWTNGEPDTCFSGMVAGAGISRMINFGCASNENCIPGVWTVSTTTQQGSQGTGLKFTFLIKEYDQTGNQGYILRPFVAFINLSLTKSTYGAGFSLVPGQVFQPSAIMDSGTEAVSMFIDIYRAIL